MHSALVFTIFEQLNIELAVARAANKSIGFVPTMGALHEGHLSLIQEASEKCDVVVVSIFVNPTQFTQAADLEKYPRTLEADIALIHAVLPKVLIIAPSVEEVYDKDIDFPGIDLVGLDLVMEGEFRPGHFQGVCHVVYLLFQKIKPEFAFFGAKDFQQVAIIQYMTQYFQLPVKIKTCPTQRNEKGLALSSRNLRLTVEQKEQSLIIYEVLAYIQKNYTQYTPLTMKNWAEDQFETSVLELEYISFVDSNSLKVIHDSWEGKITCCLAAFCGEVRLIDNMQIC